MKAGRGFTLVELLVTIGIIGVLVAILMPALNAAREASKRIQCAGNLHNLGVAASNFAADNRGRFPAGFRNLLLRSMFPMDLTNEEHGTNWWQKHGTSLNLWKKYGMAEASWLCPSADRPLWFHPDFGDMNWGNGVQTDYQYVGGINPDAVCPTLANWGTLPIAWKQGEPGAAHHVLAADLVWWGGGSGYGNGYIINHPMRSDPNRPAYQNILFGDGHVEAKTSADYTPRPPATTALTNTNHSLCHWYGIDINYYYWGPRESAPIVTHGHLNWDNPPTAPW